MNKNSGLYKKFNVERADGKPERSHAAYFVLDVVNDDHARIALAAYAKSCFLGQPDLSRDIWTMLGGLAAGYYDAAASLRTPRAG